MNALSKLYVEWVQLAARSLGLQSTCEPNPSDQVIAGTRHGWAWLPAYTGCLWAVFADSSERDEAERLFDALTHAAQLAHADPAVRADELQAAGDERGEWLATWLMPTSEYRERAILESTPALAKRLQGIVTRRRLALVRSLSKEMELGKAAAREIDFASIERSILASLGTPWHQRDFIESLHTYTSRCQYLPVYLPARHGKTLHRLNFASMFDTPRVRNMPLEIAYNTQATDLVVASPEARALFRISVETLQTLSTGTP
jgi:hypothetical protein